jgi:hypothetical protein
MAWNDRASHEIREDHVNRELAIAPPDARAEMERVDEAWMTKKVSHS